MPARVLMYCVACRVLQEDDEVEDGKDASSKPLALEAPSPAPDAKASKDSSNAHAHAPAHDRQSSLDAKTANGGRETPQKTLRPASRNKIAGGDNGSSAPTATGAGATGGGAAAPSGDASAIGQPATAPALAGALAALTDLHAAESAGKAGGSGKPGEHKELEEKESKQVRLFRTVACD